jgi:hypothetical protein
VPPEISCARRRRASILVFCIMAAIVELAGPDSINVGQNAGPC